MDGPTHCQQGDQTSQSSNQPWILIGRTDDVEAEAPSILVIWCEQSTHWKIPQCWERSRAGEEGVRGEDGSMASQMQWTWTWANFGRWWGTKRPGVLHSMGSQRVGHNWVTELNWTERDMYWPLLNYLAPLKGPSRGERYKLVGFFYFLIMLN